MKSVFFIAFLILISQLLFAQSTDKANPATTKPSYPESVRYLLPDGKIVSADKLDSVLASWNHQRFAMVHYDDKPGIVGLVPQTDAMTKRFADERKKTNVMLNRPAPDFQLDDIYGQHYRLSDLRGKVVVLNFWFTACAPCRNEMSVLNEIKKHNDPGKVIFLALALDNSAAVKQFLHIQAFDYYLLTNAKDVHTAYQVTSCPTSMVIDKEGMIRFVQASGEEIDKKLSVAIKASL